MAKQSDTVKKIVIYDRFNNKPRSKGQVFTKKSMTIPGQDLTIQEIMRRYTQGGPVGQVYLEQDISQFDRMDAMEKIDHLRQLQNTNKQMSNDIQLTINRLQITAAKDRKIAEVQAIRDQTIKEIREKTKET